MRVLRLNFANLGQQPRRELRRERLDGEPQQRRAHERREVGGGMVHAVRIRVGLQPRDDRISKRHFEPVARRRRCSEDDGGRRARVKARSAPCGKSVSAFKSPNQRPDGLWQRCQPGRSAAPRRLPTKSASATSRRVKCAPANWRMLERSILQSKCSRKLPMWRKKAKCTIWAIWRFWCAGRTVSHARLSDVAPHREFVTP